MKRTIILFILFSILSTIARGQLFSDNCSGGTNILPIQDINLCNDSQWVLVFEDNFDGDSLDLGTWKNREDFHGSLGKEGDGVYFTMDNAVVEDGLLKIYAKKERIYSLAMAWKDSNEILGDGRTNIRWFDYSIAYTISSIQFGYGCFEASCKIPSGKGFWPAMWMFGESPGPNNINIKEEIDVFEFWENKQDEMNMNVHYNDYACLTDYSGPDFSKDFHTFRMIWEPYKIEWYVDGDMVRRYSRYYQNGSEVGCRLNAWQPFQESPFPRNPMKLIFNFMIDNRDGKKPDASTPFPSTFEIDWVKYYVREDLYDFEYKSEFYTLVYPNPNQGFVTIEMDDRFSGKVRVQVSPIHSNLMIEETLQHSINQIDLSTMENGVYFLKIENIETHQVNYHKIIISK